MLPRVLTYVQPSAEPTAGDRSAARRGAGCLIEIVETILLTLVIYLVIHNFVAQPFEVEQNSMVTTIQPGDYVLIDKITPRFDDYGRGDIVVFQPPDGYEQGGVPFIKRVIGLPGETVTLENGSVFITPPGGVRVRIDEPYVVLGSDGQPAPTLPRDAQGTDSWVVGEGRYFVMGDNRPESQDSRFFGPIDRELVVGRAFLRYFPLDRITLFGAPEYAGLEPEAGLDGWLAWRGQALGGSSATIQASTSRP
jgi:signal peptidase I